MDDVAKKRFDRIEKRLGGIDERLDGVGQRLDGIDGQIEKLADRVTGNESTTQLFRQETADGLEAAARDRRAHHAEQMKAFQDVLGEVRAARDKRLADLETTVRDQGAALAELRAEVAKLRAIPPPSPV